MIRLVGPRAFHAHFVPTGRLPVPSKITALSHKIQPQWPSKLPQARSYSQRTGEQSPRDRLSAALYQGAVQANAESVRPTLQAGTNPNQAFQDGFFMLHYAAEADESAVIQQLLKAGARIDIKTLQEGDTPLHRACFHGCLEAVIELVDGGAKLHERNDNGYSPLECAILRQSAVCCNILIKAGAQVNQPNPKSGYTPLMLACKRGNAAVAKLLLEHGANPDLGGHEFPLHLAVHDPDIVAVLLKSGANKDVKISSHCPEREQIGDFPLHSAVRAGSIESVKVLLYGGANYNPTNQLQHTPLSLARRLKIDLFTRGDQTNVRLAQELERIIGLLEIVEETPVKR